MITFAAFLSQLRSIAWPQGEAPNLRSAHNSYVKNSLIELQRYVDCFKVNHVDMFDKTDTIDDCGMAILNGPRGEIGAVYAFKPECRCDRFVFDHKSTGFLMCKWEACKCEATTLCGTTSGDPYCSTKLTGGQSCQEPYLTESSNDADTGFKCTNRYFATGPGGKLYLWPKLPCDYWLAVHWRGIKRQWAATDLIWEDEDLLDLVRLYVQAEAAACEERDAEKHALIEPKYRERFASIAYTCTEETRVRKERECSEGLDQGDLVRLFVENPYDAADEVYHGGINYEGEVVTPN